MAIQLKNGKAASEIKILKNQIFNHSKIHKFIKVIEESQKAMKYKIVSELEK